MEAAFLSLSTAALLFFSLLPAFEHSKAEAGDQWRLQHMDVQAISPVAHMTL